MTTSGNDLSEELPEQSDDDLSEELPEQSDDDLSEELPEQNSQDMNTLHGDILKELECPVCEHYFDPPIYLCDNGHSICSFCRDQVQQCPTCRNKLSNKRSVTLEAIVRSLHYPCHNKKEGCTEILPHEFITEHEEICSLGKHECPLKKKFEGYEDCGWIGLWDEFRVHTNEDHEFISTHSGVKEYSVLHSSVGTTSIFGEIFLRCINREPDKWHFSTMIIGTRRQASKFKVTYTFSVKNKVEVLTKTQSVCSYTETFEDAFKSEKSLCLHQEELNKFITDGKFNMSTHISAV